MSDRSMEDIIASTLLVFVTFVFACVSAPKPAAQPQPQEINVPEAPPVIERPTVKVAKVARPVPTKVSPITPINYFPEVDIEVDRPDIEVGQESIESMARFTVGELKVLAKEQGVTLKKRARKLEIIEQLLAA